MPLISAHFEEHPKSVLTILLKYLTAKKGSRYKEIFTTRMTGHDISEWADDEIIKKSLRHLNC